SQVEAAALAPPVRRQLTGAEHPLAVKASGARRTQASCALGDDNGAVGACIDSATSCEEDHVPNPVAVGVEGHVNWPGPRRPPGAGRPGSRPDRRRQGRATMDAEADGPRGCADRVWASDWER